MASLWILKKLILNFHVVQDFKTPQSHVLWKQLVLAPDTKQKFAFTFSLHLCDWLAQCSTHARSTADLILGQQVSTQCHVGTLAVTTHKDPRSGLDQRDLTRDHL